MSELLASKISAVKRKHAIVAAARGSAALVALAVLLLSVQMLLDWLFEFPLWLRTALLAIDVTALAYVFLTHIVAPLIFGPDEDEIALMVERATPDFRTRLIAAVQLSRPGAVSAGVSSAMVGALIRQAETIAQPMDFAQVVRTTQLMRTAIVATLILILASAGFLYGGEASHDLFRRAMLSSIPVPRKTRVVSETGDRTIAIGDSIALIARAAGINPSTGKVELSYPSGREQTFIMDPANDDSSRFERLIDNVQESFNYTVGLNDGHSLPHLITALPRPVVSAIDLKQTYPGYTKRSPEKRSPGDLSLLVGSNLEVRLKANHELREAFIRLVGLEKDVRMTITGPARDEAVGSFDLPAKGLTGFSIRLVDHHGISSKAETVYPIDLVPDKEPALRVKWPDRKEELATQSAKVLIGFEATDDFAIDRVLIRYKIEGVNTTEQSVELDLANYQGDRRRIALQHYFDLAAIRPLPIEGTALEWWLDVRDGNNVTGPGRIFSDHYRVRIVSEVEKRADLMNRIGDQFSSLDAAAAEEEKLNQSLGTLVFEKTRPSTTQPAE